MADRLETHFLARLPPSRRGALGQSHAQDLTPKHSSIQEADVDVVKLLGKRRAKKVDDGDLIYEDGEVWDMSLWKAIYLVTRQQWLMAVLWNAAGRKRIVHTQGSILTRQNPFG